MKKEFKDIDLRKRVNSMLKMNRYKIPIFFITFNRLTVLKECVQAIIDTINKEKTPYQFVFCDNVSTYQPLIDWLKEKEQEEDNHVIWNNKNDLYWATKHNITQWFDDEKKRIEEDETRDMSSYPQYYVLNDPDISIRDCDGDILEHFKYMLDLNMHLQVVGTMIRIDDIPKEYQLYDHVMSRHERIWAIQKINTKWKKDKNVKYIPFMVDTTFGMYRHTFRKDNKTKFATGIRVLQPYACRHLDWYIPLDKNTPEDQKVYLKTSSGVSHWYGRIMRAYENGDMSKEDEVSRQVEHMKDRYERRLVKIKTEQNERRKKLEQKKNRILS